MNLLVISFLALASLSTFPTQTFGTPAAAAADVSSPKKSLAAAAEAVKPVNDNGLKEIWQEDDREVLIRNERGTKNGGAGTAGKKDRKKDKNSNSSSSQSSSSPTSSSATLQKLKQQNIKSKLDNTKQQAQTDSQCRYTKGPWTECDAKTNTRSRTLALKKGETSCVQTRTIQKKCKKACRYDKGAWSECAPNGQMSRTDSLKSSSDATCQSTRVVNKNCNQGKSKDKQNKPAKVEKKEKGLRKNRQ
ncbi:protein FAM133-like isoform X2 [Toxorhynchites rutilus septentrionalis]|uniref:protein FAM133-like isoform X2 n=1 Tax=Toxorhynchites rutilus septentrionalis TaxID=329112 RepID=UPI0024797B7F|nr:protein FAM133-like isoform X2 [Toxorhynchites rutilus septentrionalis]